MALPKTRLDLARASVTVLLDAQKVGLGFAGFALVYLRRDSQRIFSSLEIY